MDTPRQPPHPPQVEPKQGGHKTQPKPAEVQPASEPPSKAGGMVNQGGADHAPDERRGGMIGEG